MHPADEERHFQGTNRELLSYCLFDCSDGRHFRAEIPVQSSEPVVIESSGYDESVKTQNLCAIGVKCAWVFVELSQNVTTSSDAEPCADSE